MNHKESAAPDASVSRPLEIPQDDSQSDYHAAKRFAAKTTSRGVWKNRFPERFEPLSSREMRCDLPRKAIDAIAHGKHFASYRGLPMAKDPLDRVLYETLFFELQPRTVIELGAYTGASALWMADILKTFALDCRVISVDHDLELIDDAARLCGDIEFREADLNKVEDVFSDSELKAMEGPIVLIDDAHVNIANVYSHFDRHALNQGDYLIIEDTIPWIPDTFGPPADNRDDLSQNGDKPGEWGQWKWDEVISFFHGIDSQYLVDRYYTDFFGYNSTWNWNGFLRKS